MFGSAQKVYDDKATISTLKVVYKKPQKGELENNEEALWESFTMGSDKAFADIYGQYYPLLFNYGLKFTKERALLSDCIQDFFLYLAEKRSKLGATTSIKYYLLRAFRRRLFEYLKRDLKQKQCFTDIDDYVANVYENNIEDAIESASKNKLYKSLAQEMQRLCPKERQAIQGYYFQEIGYAEIAQMLKFSQVSSARRLIYTALKNLKQSMPEII